MNQRDAEYFCSSLFLATIKISIGDGGRLPHIWATPSIGSITESNIVRADFLRPVAYASEMNSKSIKNSKVFKKI